MLANVSESVLIVIDPQASFMGGIYGAEAMMRRINFLVDSANILEVPILVTEQNPDRMGGCDPDLLARIGKPAMPKMEFGCYLNEAFADAMSQTGRSQAILVGIESHICVCQTALQLMDDDFAVFLAEDAISARSEEMHRIAISRLRDEGARIAHSESIAYEWMESAEHPEFRQILKLVKEAN